MSITVSFSTASKRENSTKQLAMTATHECTFKNGCSMLKPTLLLEIETSTFPTYTAFKIEDRYYKVTDIVSVRNNIFEITGTIDVLATYKSTILASTQYVCYSSYNSSSWLADTRIPILKSSSYSYNSALTGILSTIGCYILSVVGEDCVSTYCTQNEADIRALLDDIANWDTSEVSSIMSSVTYNTASYSYPGATYATTDDNSNCFNALISTIKSLVDGIGSLSANVQNYTSDLNKKIQEAASKVGFIGNAYGNAPSCIRSCIWVPFDFALMPSGSGGSPIMLGRFQTSVSMAALSSKPVTGSFTISIPWHYSDWRRATCEDVYLYLPLVGMVQLSGDSLTGVSSLTVEWSVTYTDGVIAYKVNAGNTVIGSFGATGAVNYPIGIAQQASAGEQMTALIQGVQKTLASAVNSTLSPLSAGAAIGEMAFDIAVTGYDVANAQATSHISSVGGIGGGAGLGLGRYAVCYTVAHPTVITPSDMQATMGLPTMTPMSLSTLTGYCQCANAHVEVAATKTEMSIIDNYLNSGFFIE